MAEQCAVLSQMSGPDTTESDIGKRKSKEHTAERRKTQSKNTKKGSTGWAVA